LSDELPLDGEPLLAALEKANVRFIVIGGFAVSAHGHLRATKDLDIVPDPDPENLSRLASMLDQLNAKVFGMEEFEHEEIPNPTDPEALALGGNFVLTTKHGRLDVMQLISPDLEYADLETSALEDEVFGHRVRFCSYGHLVLMKEAAGRGQDLEDLKRLREARGE
jgi:hypothetical protein